MVKASGGSDLMSALAQVVPSLQMQAFGFDMSGQTLQARLRGVSPNDVLVLVNGKRRHTTANLAIDTGSPFQGGAGVEQRPQIARQRRRIQAHLRGEVDRAYRPQLHDMAQQRVLRALEAGLADLGVVMRCHAPHQLAQFQIGAALGPSHGVRRRGWRRAHAAIIVAPTIDAYASINA